MSFLELGLVEPILRAVAAEGYTTPTPIQSQAIPHVLAGRDLLGCAQTGTGKTAAFALPILHRIDRQRRSAVARAPRVVVLAPTRELASQIGQSFAVYGRHLHFRHTVIFGGVGQAPQVRALAHGVHILVATPGRLIDLMSQGHVRLDQLEVFVLDEADRMMDMGFLPDVKRIISHLPRRRQSLFFSATMPPNIASLAHSLLVDPVRVSVSPPATTVERIQQHIHFVERAHKKALLHKVVSATECHRALVFTRTKHGADKVARQLGQQGIKVDAIHGNKSQSARERALSRFRTGSLHVLVATDVAARGIDVDNISHVINYDLPVDPESYVHRIGRTGRAGATGIALSFCDSSERGALRAIEQLVRQRIPIAGRQHDRAPTTTIAAPASSHRPNKPAAPSNRTSRNYRRFGKKRLVSSWR
jgi:ATP-dependent RNA helicase RhlE